MTGLNIETISRASSLSVDPSGSKYPLSPSFAQVGVGQWGKNILRNLYELNLLHTACEINQMVISHLKEKFPGAGFTTSFEEVLENPDIQAVIVATPAATHYELVKKAILAGKDVFVEKPLALRLEEGQEVVDLAERKGKVLMVGHILQYHPAVLKLKELISAGELGRVEYIYSNRLNIGQLRTEENILWSFAPHDISVVMMLLGEEPVGIRAFGGDYLNQGIYDTTMTTLKFKNGVKGHIFVSWLHPYKEQKLIVVGSRAMAVFDDLSKEKLFVYPHTIEWKEGKIPVAQKAEYQAVSFHSAEPLKEEMKHFGECVRFRKRPRTDGHEGLKVLKVLQEAQSSLAMASISVRANLPRTRPRVFPQAFIHESSYVDESVEVGSGTKIWHFCHVLKGSKIGKGCILGQNVMIGTDVTIGDRCKLQNNVSVYKGVTLQEEVFCGPSCVFTNVYNPRAFIERKQEFRLTLVKRGATIGANATIICGTTVGEYAMVGGGAVVKSDIPDYGIVAGVPAKQIGWACKCGTTLRIKDNRATCSYCANEYSVEDHRLVVIKEV